MKQGIFTWAELNKRLREHDKEKDVQQLLDSVRSQGASNRWVNRIYQRYSLLRKRRERRALKLPEKG